MNILQQLQAERERTQKHLSNMTRLYNKKYMQKNVKNEAADALLMDIKYMEGYLDAINNALLIVEPIPF